MFSHLLRSVHSTKTATDADKRDGHFQTDDESDVIFQRWSRKVVRCTGQGAAMGLEVALNPQRVSWFQLCCSIISLFR